MTAEVIHLPRLNLPQQPGLYTEKSDPRTWGDLWMLTDTGWWHAGRRIADHGVPARLHPVGVLPDTPAARPLNQVETQLISRAVEAWAYRVRAEGRNLDLPGLRDEAHGHYAQADQAQAVLNLLPWMRVTE